MAVIYRTERSKTLSNFQMPPTPSFEEQSILECFESLEEVLRGFESSTSQTCDVNKILTLFSWCPPCLLSKLLNFESRPPSLLSLNLWTSPASFTRSSEQTGRTPKCLQILSLEFPVSICFSSTSYSLIHTRNLYVEEKVETNILRIFLDELYTV